jgi:hypothetical protein
LESSFFINLNITIAAVKSLHVPVHSMLSVPLSLIHISVKITIKVKYAYQEWPHPADTASPHSQNVERRRKHGYKMINFKIDWND